MSYEEEDTCVPYEEEDTCVSYEEEDTCVPFEEEDTCVPYEEVKRSTKEGRWAHMHTYHACIYTHVYT